MATVGIAGMRHSLAVVALLLAAVVHSLLGMIELVMNRRLLLRVLR